MTIDPSAIARPSRPQLVVAIGASAGGLAALEAFIDSVPPNTGIAFIIVSHHQASSENLMPELLARHTTMPVTMALDKERAEPAHVYVIPAGRAAGFSNGAFVLAEPSEAREHLPIDHFFESVALDQGARAVGIVLSGAAHDGSEGIRAIRQEGGLTIAQQPATAEFPSMPSAAIATHAVEHVLEPGKMVTVLLARAALSAATLIAPEVTGDLLLLLPKVCAQLRAHCGHDFSGYKPSTLLRRIQRRMGELRVKDAEAYAESLRTDAREARILCQELMIGVTSFFRDPEAFVSLRLALAKSLRTGDTSAPVRAWVAGCSTGEEAYSLAMVLRETIDEVGPYRPSRVFATDIDSRGVNTGRAGIYPADAARDLSPERLAKFFVPQDARLQVRTELRETIIFAAHNLITDPPFTRIDVLSCRNVLMYLDAKVQREVLGLFHYALKPGGLIFLGSAESLGSYSDGFVAIDKRWSIFQRKETSQQLRGGAPTLRRSESMRTSFASPSPARIGMNSLAENFLADLLVPPSVIVDEHGQILHVHGRTGDFLEPTPGEPNMNVFRMARAGLRMELPAALRQVMLSGKPFLLEGVKIKTGANGNEISVNVRVSRIEHSPFAVQVYVVIFERVDLLPPPSETWAVEEGPTQKPLEDEIHRLQEILQSTIEEYETANEELKASNEELQSANEELQLANEELETSKEEQQSLNEELQMLNAELKDKVENLSRAHDDMRNLLNSTDVATFFLDMDLKIKRFTQGAVRIANLIQSDIGRPISDLGMKVDMPDLVARMQEVLASLAFQEREVRSVDGKWYLMRILPYRTAENVIDGIVVTFVDVTESKRIQAQVSLSREIMVRLIRAAPDPTVILDSRQRIVLANAAFLTLAGPRAGAIEQRELFKVIPGLESFPDVFGTEGRDGQVGLALDLPRGRTQVLVSSERIPEDGQPELMLVSFKANEPS